MVASISCGRRPVANSAWCVKHGEEAMSYWNNFTTTYNKLFSVWDRNHFQRVSIRFLLGSPCQIPVRLLQALVHLALDIQLQTLLRLKWSKNVTAKWDGSLLTTWCTPWSVERLSSPLRERCCCKALVFGGVKMDPDKILKRYRFLSFLHVSWALSFLR